jgi:flagellar protein FlaG
MTEEEISGTGQFNALSSADFPSSYRSPNGGAGQSTNATPGAAPATGSVAGESPTTTGSPPASSASAARGVPTATQSAKAASALELQAAVDKANANLSSSNRVMDFRVDAATGLTIATIRNSQTGVVLQQIPGADIMALAQMLAGWSPGKHMLLDLIA